MTFTRLHISTFLAISAVAWGLVLYQQGTEFTGAELLSHLRPFSTVVGVLVSMAFVLEHVAWRLPLLQGWFVKRPDLRGTWRVNLQSDWIRPETGLPVDAIWAYMGVTQTLSTLQMHLMTPESESWFIADEIRPSRNGVGYEVIGVYSNEPNTLLRGVRSEIHRGALVFNTHGSPAQPTSLTGDYWTDRGTKGTMVLDEKDGEVFTRFEDAQSHMGRR